MKGGMTPDWRNLRCRGKNRPRHTAPAARLQPEALYGLYLTLRNVEAKSTKLIDIFYSNLEPKKCILMFGFYFVRKCRWVLRQIETISDDR